MESRPDFSGRAFFISSPKEVSGAGAGIPPSAKFKTALAPPAPEKGVEGRGRRIPPSAKFKTALAPPAPEKGVGGRGGNPSVRKIQTALAPPAPERGVEGRGQRIPRLHNTTTGKAFRLSLPLGAENGIRTRVSRERFRDCLSTPPAPERGVEDRGQRILRLQNSRQQGEPFGSPCCLGAENGIRTRDPQLGKLMLYRLSYFRITEYKDTPNF